VGAGPEELGDGEGGGSRGAGDGEGGESRGAGDGDGSFYLISGHDVNLSHLKYFALLLS